MIEFKLSVLCLLYIKYEFKLNKKKLVFYDVMLFVNLKRWITLVIVILLSLCNLIMLYKVFDCLKVFWGPGCFALNLYFNFWIYEMVDNLL